MAEHALNLRALFLAAMTIINFLIFLPRPHMNGAIRNRNAFGVQLWPAVPWYDFSCISLHLALVHLGNSACGLIRDLGFKLRGFDGTAFVLPANATENRQRLLNHGSRMRSTIFPGTCPSARRACALAALISGNASAIGTLSFAASMVMLRRLNSRTLTTLS
jgi:hypothetical protein